MEGNPRGCNDGGSDLPSISEPSHGMEFDTKESAYSFYRDYAWSIGFGVTIKASRRSKITRKFIDVKFACSRYGTKRENDAVVNPRPCIRTGCNARMHIKRREDGKWVVRDFADEHNHDMCTDDYYNNAVRLRNRPSRPFPSPCQKIGLRSMLGEDDAGMLMEFLAEMRAASPNFFYAVDLCPENSLRCVFWVDPKGRSDYTAFFDVVLIDSYYLKEGYNVPLVTMVGVNQHMQYSLLGCALIAEESSENYAWLIRTWLRAMLGRAPGVVLTDRDEFMKEAVSAVLLDSHHCFCLWNVYEAITKYLGHVVSKHPEFLDQFDECVRASWTVDEFESRWQDFVSRFDLHSEEWMSLLYEDRYRWMPAYMPGVYFGGLSTPERKGSIAAFFDKYMERTSSYTEFIERYKAYAIDRYLLEAEAENDSDCKIPSSPSASLFEWQMSGIYTRAVYEKFQSEVSAAGSCNLERATTDDAGCVLFRVDDIDLARNFTVSWKEADCEISCLCRLFEYWGFLCRHAVLVLQSSGVHCLPDRYILKRWTRNTQSERPVSETSSGTTPTRLGRFNNLCKLAVKLGEEASLSNEAYNHARQALDEASTHCNTVNRLTGGISSTLGIRESKQPKRRKTRHKKFDET